MLELDSDLFQTAVLGLLLVSFLILLLVLNNLSKIRKTLEEGLTRSQIGDITSPAAAEHTHTQAPGEAAEPVPVWSPESAAAASPATAGGESSWSGPSETAAIPVQQAPAASAAPSQAGPNLADMPEEQPVEHEGRWWFKRGGELLIYDESTGQWGPAPQAAVAPAAAPPGGGSPYSDFKDLSVSEPAVEPAAGGSSGGEGSGFWKCPSCGAVNGSTASSCRMCFAARA